MKLVRLLGRILVGNRLGRWAMVIGAVALLVYLSRSYLTENLYPQARDEVLRTVGFGVIPMMFWATLVFGAFRLRPKWLIRWWRWWLATGLLVLAGQAIMGGIHGSTGIVAETTLGGNVGGAIWGKSALQGVPIVAGLGLLAQIILWPRATYRKIRSLFRHIGKLLQILARLFWGWIWRGIGHVGQWIQAGVHELAEAWRRRTVARARVTKASDVMSSERLDDEAFQPVSAEHGVVAIEESKVTIMGAVTSEPRETKDDVVMVPGRPGIEKKITAYSGSGWAIPPMDLLESGNTTSVPREETVEVARKIEETLSHHGVEVVVDQIKPGPTVTLYGLTPGWIRKSRDVRQRDEAGNLLRDVEGKPVITRQKEQTRVKVDSIVAREKDLALALAAPSLRIQAPVPSESVVGIEVPNRESSLVTVRSVMESSIFQNIVQKGGLALALGQGSGGDPIAADLRQLPHLLIAGATGSGKSVCINAIIVSMVSQVSPERLRLLLIDPKRVELTPYNGLPHLVAPVVVDTEPAVKALKGMLREMFRRYRRMEELGVRNIDGYLSHPQAPEPMPYLVIAVDELADLMMSAPYDIEQTVCRLAQLGRATGIHLIVATQRPSVDVVTGLIKANFPSRISFAVVSNVDSRTILDSAGAERLLGKGDMLFLSSETPKPQRVQGAFVSDQETSKLMEFWRSGGWPPLPPFDLEPEPEEGRDDRQEDGAPLGPQDELFDKAVELASRYSHMSTSLLQRRLRIGYPRAARLMDQLEDEGIISSGEPGKSREVLIPRRPQGS